MVTHRLLTLLVTALAVGWCACRTARAEIRFNRDIRPLLADRCFKCHGPDSATRKAELRLDRRDAVVGTAVLPGRPRESELFLRVSSEDPELRMPPESSGRPALSAEEIERVGQWIAEGAEYEEHWSLAPLRIPVVPEVVDRSWPVGAIDRFVLATLEAAGIEPSESAGQATLLRRLSLDLTGLPPQPHDVQRYLDDDAPDAYERLLDRLLASPHFGERMAIYWLDLVRYADSVGYHGDQEHPITPYRDYVIDAFNENMPFDQFTVEQLAGDLLPEPTVRQRVATGYNRVLQTSHEGGVQKKDYLVRYAADRVRNLSAAWMGITMGCAECHDHKYDPYPQRDFYRLAAFFADVDDDGSFRGSDTTPTKREPEMVVDGRRTMVTVSVAPRTVRVLPRGDWLDETGEVVEPGVPERIAALDVADRRATRLDLARWLTLPDHPLTARVLANRMWYLFFGAGLSRTLDDTGSQGQWPTHPELLDWLACDLARGGWDIKRCVRRIASSRTYRQRSASGSDLLSRDPGNRLLARQSRFRVPAEWVRDTVLSVSGLLVRRIGGESARPYQPAGYYQHLNFPQREYQPDQGAGLYRRGVYTHWQRQYLHPMLKAFDAPSREECTAERPRSNTPLSALVLLNDPSVVEAARALALRAIREGGEGVEARVRWLWREALLREASGEEYEVLESLYRDSLEELRSQTHAAAELVSVGEMPLPEGIDIEELGAWTSVARAVLNVGELYVRN